MDNILSNNLSDYLLSTLSNMLGLHYATDEKLQKVEQDVSKYAGNIAKRVSDFLGEEVVLDETFEMAMNLFIVALSPTMPNREEPPNLKHNKEVLVNTVGNFCFGDNIANAAEMKELSKAIDNIVDSENASQMLDVISKHPSLLRGMVQQKLPPNQIKENLTKAANSNTKQSSILADYAMFAGIALCGTLGLAAGFAASTYIGAVASVSVIPAAAISLKFGTKLGENWGTKLAEFEGGFRTHSNNLSTMLGNFMPSMSKNNSLTPHEQAKQNEQSISAEKVQEISEQNIGLGDMMKELSTHVSSKEDIEKSKDIKIEKTRNQNKDFERQ